MNLKTLRGMLKYLQLYASKNWDIEETSLAYQAWAKAWNEKVRAKKWERPQVYLPPFLSRFVEEIASKRDAKEARQKVILRCRPPCGLDR